MTVYGTNSNVGIGTETPVTTSHIRDCHRQLEGLLPATNDTQHNVDNIVTPATGLTMYLLTVPLQTRRQGDIDIYNGTTWRTI
jgi:hypothetical protein